MPTALEDLKILRSAEKIAETIWSEVSTWKSFDKRVVGEQITRSADSIGANIAEAYGRFHYGDKLKFLYYARGSLFETKYWINRANIRKLIASEKCDALVNELRVLAVQINSFSQSINQQRAGVSKIKEEQTVYETSASADNSIFSEEDIHAISTL